MQFIIKLEKQMKETQFFLVNHGKSELTVIIKKLTNIKIRLPFVNFLSFIIALLSMIYFKNSSLRTLIQNEIIKS